MNLQALASILHHAANADGDQAIANFAMMKDKFLGQYLSNKEKEIDLVMGVKTREIAAKLIKLDQMTKLQERALLIQEKELALKEREFEKEEKESLQKKELIQFAIETAKTNEHGMLITFGDVGVKINGKNEPPAGIYG